MPAAATLVCFSFASEGGAAAVAVAVVEGGAGGRMVMRSGDGFDIVAERREGKREGEERKKEREGKRERRQWLYPQRTKREK